MIHRRAGNFATTSVLPFPECPPPLDIANPCGGGSWKGWWEGSGVKGGAVGIGQGGWNGKRGGRGQGECEGWQWAEGGLER